MWYLVLPPDGDNQYILKVKYFIFTGHFLKKKEKKKDYIS